MTENLSITQLRTFLCVASLGSFRKTATQMKTTQPAISSRIAKLEKILGARLFDRNTGKIHITPEGEALRPHAESMVRTANDLSRYLKGDTAVSGTVRIGVTEFAITTWMTGFMDNLPRVFPNVELDLIIDSGHNLKTALTMEKLDIAFIQGPVSDERIQSIKYASYEYCWAAAASAGLQPHTLYTVPDLLERYPLITDTVQTRLYHEVKCHIKSRQVTSYRLFPSASYSASRELLKMGGTVAILPKRLINDELAKGDLIQIMADWTPAPLHFSGCYLDGPNKHLAERLIGFVKSLL